VGGGLLRDHRNHLPVRDIRREIAQAFQQSGGHFLAARDQEHA